VSWMPPKYQTRSSKGVLLPEVTEGYHLNHDTSDCESEASTLTLASEAPLAKMEDSALLELVKCMHQSMEQARLDKLAEQAQKRKEEMKKDDETKAEEKRKRDEREEDTARFLAQLEAMEARFDRWEAKKRATGNCRKREID